MIPFAAKHASVSQAVLIKRLATAVVAASMLGLASSTPIDLTRRSFSYPREAAVEAASVLNVVAGVAAFGGSFCPRLSMLCVRSTQVISGAAWMASALVNQAVTDADNNNGELPGGKLVQKTKEMTASTALYARRVYDEGTMFIGGFLGTSTENDSLKKSYRRRW